MSKFLVFDGLDGSGKSSLMKSLEDKLRERGIQFQRTREPGGTRLGSNLRTLILSKEGPVPVPRAELLMYEADRAQHVDEVILPALKKGAWVISDRYSSSSLAFQAGGRAISESDVLWLNRFATGGLDAHLTVMLDLSVEEARKRRNRRSDGGGDAEDRMEAEADAFHERVREGFLKQARQAPDRWLVLSGQDTPEVLLEKLLAALKDRAWLD
jgi:dTMP kinase